MPELMRSTTNSTGRKANKFLIITALVLFPLLATERASAQNATATLLSGGLNSISIAQNGTFTLDINIVTTFQSVGMTYFMQMLDAAGFGQFEISARNIGASPFNDLITNDAGAVGNPNGILNPTNVHDLGAVIADPNSPLAAGSYFIATLTFIPTSGMFTPGVYHMTFDSRSIVADGGFNDHAITANTFTITVVPEPATTGLAVLGGLMLLGFAWKARRALA